MYLNRLVGFWEKIVNTGAWVTCQFIDVIDMIYGMKLTENEIGNKAINISLIAVVLFLLILFIKHLWKKISGVCCLLKVSSR